MCCWLLQWQQASMLAWLHNSNDNGYRGNMASPTIGVVFSNEPLTLRGYHGSHGNVMSNTSSTTGLATDRCHCHGNSWHLSSSSLVSSFSRKWGSVMLSYQFRDCTLLITVEDLICNLQHWLVHKLCYVLWYAIMCNKFCVITVHFLVDLDQSI